MAKKPKANDDNRAKPDGIAAQKTEVKAAQRAYYEPTFLTVKQVCGKIGVSKTAFYRLKKNGGFIQPVASYQKHHHLYDAEQVNQWMLAQRRQSQD